MSKQLLDFIIALLLGMPIACVASAVNTLGSRARSIETLNSNFLYKNKGSTEVQNSHDTLRLKMMLKRK